MPVQPQPQFDNPDETIEQVMQPVADEESSSDDRTLTEPIRLQMKQRHVSHDSMINRQGLSKGTSEETEGQLPGHQQAIVPPPVKPPRFEDEDEKHQLLVLTIKMFLFRPQLHILLHHRQRSLKTPQIMIHLRPEVKRQSSIMIRKKQKNQC